MKGRIILADMLGGALIAAIALVLTTLTEIVAPKCAAGCSRVPDRIHRAMRRCRGSADQQARTQRGGESGDHRHHPDLQEPPEANILALAPDRL